MIKNILTHWDWTYSVEEKWQPLITSVFNTVQSRWSLLFKGSLVRDVLTTIPCCDLESDISNAILHSSRPQSPQHNKWVLLRAVFLLPQITDHIIKCMEVDLGQWTGSPALRLAANIFHSCEHRLELEMGQGGLLQSNLPTAHLQLSDDA